MESFWHLESSYAGYWLGLGFNVKIGVRIRIMIRVRAYCLGFRVRVRARVKVKHFYISRGVHIYHSLKVTCYG